MHFLGSMKSLLVPQLWRGAGPPAVRVIAAQHAPRPACYCVSYALHNSQWPSGGGAMQILKPACRPNAQPHRVVQQSPESPLDGPMTTRWWIPDLAFVAQICVHALAGAAGDASVGIFAISSATCLRTSAIKASPSSARKDPARASTARSICDCMEDRNAPTEGDSRGGPDSVHAMRPSSSSRLSPSQVLLRLQVKMSNAASPTYDRTVSLPHRPSS